MAVDTFKGEQHAPDFLKVNPNAKVPAIEDNGAVVFDSNATVSTSPSRPVAGLLARLLHR